MLSVGLESGIEMHGLVDSERKFPVLASPAERLALDEIAHVSARIDGVVKVVVFGSRARGDFDGGSDLDILIVLADICAKDAVISALHEIELEHDVPLSPVVMTMRELDVNKRLGSGFVLNVEKDGIILYEARSGR